MTWFTNHTLTSPQASCLKTVDSLHYYTKSEPTIQTLISMPMYIILTDTDVKNCVKQAENVTAQSSYVPNVMMPMSDRTG